MSIHRITDLPVKYPKLSLLLALLLSLSFLYAGKDVRFNNNFSVLFAVDNEANEYRDFYRKEFGADDGLLMAIIQPVKVDDAFFERLQRLSDDFEQQAFFQRVNSPTNTAVIRNNAKTDEVFIDPLFNDFADDLTLDEKIQLLRQSSTTAGRLISTHSNTFAILAQMPKELDSYKKIQQPAAYFQQSVENTFATNSTVHFAGIAFSRIGILDLMYQDLFVLIPLTALIVALVSFIIFRSVAVVAINSLCILFSNAATLGLMGINNDHINQLTITFPVLLMVIVVANGIHFYHRYFRELDNTGDCQAAVFMTTQQVSKAAFLSCFTTAIGFFALFTADMPILRSFGFYLGGGVLLAFIGMILIIPACLSLFQPQPKVGKHSISFIHIRWVDSLVKKLMQRRWRNIVICCGGLSLVAGSFIAANSKYDYFMEDMLNKDHPQVIAANFAEKHLSGSFPIEISMLGHENDFKSAQVLKKILLLQQWLDEKGIGSHALSVASIVQSLNLAINNDNDIPDTNAAVAQLLLLAEGSSDGIVEQLVNFDFSHARIRLYGPDRGATLLVELEKEFRIYADNLMQGSGIKVRMTGEAPVAYHGMNRLAKELMQSVLVAVIFIIITIQLVFRDIRLSLAAIFPNIMPIVIGLAFYQLSGQALNPLPGIAFCIAIGIAVDDTVHLFARFNEELALGKTREQAIMDAVYEVKGALISSSIILTSGFLVFLISGFSWNRDLGWLGAALIIIALIADLIFTPVFLSLTGKEQATKNTCPD